jgi:soluble lytic murein transglycosylase-like protein
MNLSSYDELVPYEPPEAEYRYDELFTQVENYYDLPTYMLARVAHAETGGTFDPRKRNLFSGAAGMFQFMPATARALKIDPYNVNQAAWAAGKYLRYLYKMFGNWQEALAAYNWGPGNVRKKGLKRAPRETKHYFASIIADLGIS